MAHPVETEFKLRATGPIEPAALDAAIREAGFLCRSLEARRHVDTYYDDAAGSLTSAGIGLRVRADGRGSRITCKARGQRGGGLHVRAEIEAPWPATDPPRAASELPPDLRDAVEPFVLDRPLVARIRIATERETRLLQSDARDSCAVMLDRAEASAREHEHAVRFTEIEIEVADDLPGCERLAQCFGKRLPVRMADDDKPTHAATLLGLPKPSNHRCEIGPDAPAGAVTGTIVADLLESMHRAEAAVRSDDDPDHLHSMRVAVRRLRCIVRAFRGTWATTTADAVLEHLGATGRRLGTLRDLDVMIAAGRDVLGRLPPGLQTAGADLLPWVARHRQEELASLRAWLRSSDRLDAARRLDDDLRAGDAGELATQPLALALPPRIAKAALTARKLAAKLPADLPTEPLHAFRIAIKRLRYLAEDFGALPAGERDKSLRRLVRLQADLGAVCDHELAAAHWLGWLPLVPAGADAGLTAAAVGGFATCHARLARAARRRLQRTLARVDRKKFWRRFVA